MESGLGKGINSQYTIVETSTVNSQWLLLVAQVIEHKAGPKGCLVPCVELTVNSQTSTVKHQQSTVNSQQSTVNCYFTGD